MNRLPAGACDTHMHFYDGRYESVPDAPLVPPDATPTMYVAAQKELGLERTVVVQPSPYGLDNRCQLDGMATLRRKGSNPDAVRGVMVIDSSATRAEVETLHSLGVRGARFHMLPGGAVPWDHLEPVAQLIADWGWHIQLQLNGRELAERLDQLLALPTEVVVDHVGRFMPPVAVDDPNFRALLTLVERKGWVKLSAPYESSTEPRPHDDVAPLVAALVDEVPERLVWASNWPHPGQANPPSSTDLLDWAAAWLPTESLRRRVLVENATTLYDFPATPPKDPDHD